MSLIIRVEPRIHMNSKDGCVNFDIGYFSSSYNQGGLDFILKQCTGKNLNYIFSGNCEEIEQNPNWEDVLRRAKEVLCEMYDFISQFGQIFIKKINFKNKNNEINSEFSALNVYKEKFKDYLEADNLQFVLSGEGCFFLKKSFQLKSVINGIDSFTGEKCLYLICEKLEEKKNSLYSEYIKQLEIIIETCDFILTEHSPNKYKLDWSR